MSERWTVIGGPTARLFRCEMFYKRYLSTTIALFYNTVLRFVHTGCVAVRLVAVRRATPRAPCNTMHLVCERTLTGPFLLSYFLFSVFLYFFVSVPWATLSWHSRQLLSARKSAVSYRINCTSQLYLMRASFVCQLNRKLTIKNQKSTRKRGKAQRVARPACVLCDCAFFTYLQTG